ncbi:hypothetical protein L1987_13653 [Smallanthus sonchifolius]|uniref:Uncharacterized protein n=1 Tax=Smallanthus sonchifolius TaxID=185202 RepID=A0ACB9JI14_9ASTR|nr:hypothetical protein L1987_13653 [Smallanthus sonchifolius]
MGLLRVKTLMGRSQKPPLAALHLCFLRRRNFCFKPSSVVDSSPSPPPPSSVVSVVGLHLHLLRRRNFCFKHSSVVDSSPSPPPPCRRKSFFVIFRLIFNSLFIDVKNIGEQRG